jgi:hypothetical protein
MTTTDKTKPQKVLKEDKDCFNIIEDTDRYKKNEGYSLNLIEDTTKYKKSGIRLIKFIPVE